MKDSDDFVTRSEFEEYKQAQANGWWKPRYFWDVSPRDKLIRTVIAVPILLAFIALGLAMMISGRRIEGGFYLFSGLFALIFIVFVWIYSRTRK